MKKRKKKLSLGFGIGGERHSSVIPSSSHAINPSLPLSDQSQPWSSAPRLQSKTCRNRNIITGRQNSRCACRLSHSLFCLCVKLRGGLWRNIPYSTRTNSVKRVCLFNLMLGFSNLPSNLCRPAAP